MTASRNILRVRMVFLIGIVLLLIPSRWMAFAHGSSGARLAGATLSTFLVWWLLYRLCIRVQRQAWFIAAAVAALYVGVFGAPVFAWGMLFVMYLIHIILFRSPVETVPSSVTPPPRAPPPEFISGDQPVTLMRVVDLDDVCTPYRRFLFSQRVIRAATAASASMILIIVPVAASLGTTVPLLPLTVFGVGFAAFAGGVAWLYFAWMWALWRGSLTAAKIGLILTIAGAALLTAAYVVEFKSEVFATGKIWFAATAFTMQLTLLAALGMGSAIVLLRQHDEKWRRLLQPNASRGWREALWQLTGVVLPRRISFRGLMQRSVVLSALAFGVEGAAFYVYFKAPGRILDAGDIMRLPYPGRPTALELHYFSLVTLSFFILPIIYVGSQLTIAAADRLRTAARRASLRAAEDLLEEDRRAPVVFLRDFKDDQVALERSALPEWTRVVDPGLEQDNLEDVLETSISAGPVVAIGRPADAHPPIGVARRYVSGDAWREVVISLVDAAAFIVVGASRSQGVTWEIEQLRDRGHAGKTLFVMPPREPHARGLMQDVVTMLLAPAGADPGIIEAELTHATGSRHIAGFTLRDGIVNIFTGGRTPSQIEFDAMLRLALPSTRVGAAAI